MDCLLMSGFRKEDALVCHIASRHELKDTVTHMYKGYLESVLKQGAESAERLARKTLAKVYRKIGFIPKF